MKNWLKVTAEKSCNPGRNNRNDLGPKVLTDMTSLMTHVYKRSIRISNEVGKVL